MKQKVIKMVEKMLYAKRNGNIKLEQKYYDQLYDFCEKNNIDFSNAIQGATKELKKSISAIMNSIV